MGSIHTSPQCWQAAANLLGQVGFSDSFDEMRANALLPLHRLFRTDFVTLDHWDNLGRMLSFRAYPDPGNGLAKLVAPFAAFIAEHPMLPLWHDITDRGRRMHLSELMPVGKFLRTNLWNEVYIHQGTKYQLAFGGRIDAASTWTVSFGRLTKDFGPRELELQKFLRPRLNRLVAAITRRERAISTAAQLSNLFREGPSAFALVSHDARIFEFSPAARALVERHISGGMQNPTRALLACKELRASLAKGRPEPSSTSAAATNGRVRPSFESISVGSLGVLVVRLMPDGTALLLLQLAGDSSSQQRHPRLTRRETEILAWIGEGKTNPDIAALLAISPRTDEKHCENLFAKLGVESRLGAALLGRRPA